MPAVPSDLAELLIAERPRLVGLCAVMTGDWSAAEDLAQETLLEAWQHADRLYDPSGIGPWLSAIARNVCLRWRRRRGRDIVHLADVPDYLALQAPCTGVDFEADLEREELARLLDRAMALLPPETRAALVARYIEEIPQAHVALQLGLSEGAVAMRLQRGKLALRRLLATELRDEAVAYGLARNDDGWANTQLWCPLCGRIRLRGRLIRTTGEFMLRCPTCNAASDVHLSHAVMPRLHRSGHSPRAAASRLRDWLQQQYWSPHHGGLVRCSHCERLIAPALGPNDGNHDAQYVRYALVTECTTCGTRNRMWLASLPLGLPEVQAFWRTYPRMHIRPERDIAWEGRPAILLGFEDLYSAARLEVVVKRDASVISLHLPG